MKNILLKAYYVVIPILLLGVYYGYSSFFLCLFFIILRLALTTKQTIGFYLLLFGGLIAGLTRAVAPSIPIYGLMLDILGLLILFKDYRDITKVQKNGITALFVVFVIFFISYMFAVHTPYANSKMLEIVQHGLFLFFGYYVFDKSKDIDCEALVQLLLVSTIGIIAFSCQYYNIISGGLFDYEWYRNGCVLWSLKNEQASALGDYQKVGMYAAFAAALYLSNIQAERNRLIFYLLIATQIILTSGCRQALLALIVVCFLRMSLFSDSKTPLGRITLIGLAFVFLYVVLYYLQNSNIETITDTFESGDEGRSVIYLGALNVISTHPIFGVGLGGFPMFVDASWPHNMILEILCECGVVGFVAVLLVVVVFVKGSRVSVKHLTASNNYLFLFLMALVVRVLVSGDLTLSIELFSALFACSAMRTKPMERHEDKETIEIHHAL